MAFGFFQLQMEDEELDQKAKAKSYAFKTELQAVFELSELQFQELNHLVLDSCLEPYPVALIFVKLLEEGTKLDQLTLASILK